MINSFKRVSKAVRGAAHYVDAKTTAVAVVAFGPLLAHAADGDPFAQTVAEAKSKIGEYGAALIGVAAAGVVLMIGVKYVKKIRGAA